MMSLKNLTTACSAPEEAFLSLYNYRQWMDHWDNQTNHIITIITQHHTGGGGSLV